MKISIFFLSSLLFFYSYSHSHSQIGSNLDRIGLEIYYKSLGGEYWKNSDGWNTNQTLCQWYGVQCDYNLRVINLSLYSNNLTGIIPQVPFGSFTYLQSIDLSKNKIISGLQNLVRLSLVSINLQSNQVQENLPENLFQNSNLTYLNLINNKIYGQIPDNIPKESSLKNLFLNKNQLSGTFPNSISNATQLYYIDISYNMELSGLIDPYTFQNLSNLETIHLTHCNLTGDLPVIFSESVKSLDFGNNQFTGKIPKEWGKMVNLERSILNNNQLTGGLEKLIDLPHVRVIEIIQNQFSEPFPSLLDSQVNILNARGNNFTGTLKIRSASPMIFLDITANNIQNEYFWWDDVEPILKPLHYYGNMSCADLLLGSFTVLQVDPWFYDYKYCWNV